MTRAIVVGAGVAGLASAIALCRAGYEVAIHERAMRLEPLGAALSIWPNGMAALRALGVDGAIRRGAAPIRSLGLWRRDGRSLMGRLDVGGQACLPTRALLQEALVEALGDIPFDLDAEVVDIAQTADTATVTFANGERATADLAIDAQGIWSKTADQLLGTRATHRGYGGVLALSAPIESDLRGAASEYWGDGERFGVCDLGAGRCYWFYMRDEPGGPAVAPSLGEIAARASGWPPMVSEAIDATAAASLIPFSIHARDAPKRLGAGRILCVGDAAHAMEPNLGQGACHGLEDAAALMAVATTVPPDRIVALRTTAAGADQADDADCRDRGQAGARAADDAASADRADTNGAGCREPPRRGGPAPDAGLCGGAAGAGLTHSRFPEFAVPGGQELNDDRTIVRIRTVGFWHRQERCLIVVNADNKDHWLSALRP